VILAFFKRFFLLIQYATDCDAGEKRNTGNIGQISFQQQFFHVIKEQKINRINHLMIKKKFKSEPSADRVARE
jgi:hypothetical protein